MNKKPQVLLDHYLKQLRLPTMLREYRKIAEQCAREDVDCQRFLLRLVELEVVEREQRSTERRIKAAKFPVLKSLETFDFLAMPSLNKALVLELARCEYIGRRENVLALGNSGTGKTHVGLALGLAACQQGYRVRFITAAALVLRGAGIAVIAGHRVVLVHTAADRVTGVIRAQIAVFTNECCAGNEAPVSGSQVSRPLQTSP